MGSPRGVITRIFQGELNEGSLTGFHSEAEKSLENQKMRIKDQPAPIELYRTMCGLPYYLKVEVLIDGKWSGAKESTFFPHPARVPSRPFTAPADDPEKKPRERQLFTKDNLVLWIEQALTKHAIDPSLPEGTPRQATKDGGIKVNGVSCKVTYNSGQVATIYPSVTGERLKELTDAQKRTAIARGGPGKLPQL